MKRNQRHEKRVKKMILSTGLFAVLLVASTYAWFIGMQSVGVTAFDVKIAGIDGLQLSLTGVPTSFSEEVTINAANYDFEDYSTNQNTWGGKDGLIPMSSVGVVDDTTSKLVLFEKGSFTATPGGYRIMASQVENTASAEAEGYVAFDLFIKNLSGEAYYSNYDELNEEAIYLTRDSKVDVAVAGGGSTLSDFAGDNGTGIENSVRVAFAQIARVEATEDDETVIQGMNCASSGDVTTICSKRTAQIWEPNDTAHEENAISWYKAACKKRKTTGDDVHAEESYAGECATISNGNAYPTYAISGVIDEDYLNVNTYDGAAYNNYTANTATSPAEGKLYSYPYFTDTMKLKTGKDRPTFMTLAPNSITKVRVYVWIEGQDVDNYDFAQLGKAISVGFGLTKEQFTDKDVDYKPGDTTATLPDDVVGDY